MFRQKPGILILDLYLYNIKIQTNIKQNSIKLYAEKSKTSKNIFNFFYWAGPGPLILGWARLVRPSEQWSTLHYSHATWRGGRLTCWRSQWCWWRWRGSRRWFTVVMTVAGSVCCSFSSSSSCRDTSLCFFFCLPRLLLFCSSPFGLWWGWSCWWLSDGAVEVAGRWSCCGGRRWLFSSLCRGVSLCFLFLCWSILLSQWRRCGSNGEEDQRWFSFFLPSSSITFFPRLSVSFVLFKRFPTLCFLLLPLFSLSFLSPSCFLFFSSLVPFLPPVSFFFSCVSAPGSFFFPSLCRLSSPSLCSTPSGFYSQRMQAFSFAGTE